MFRWCSVREVCGAAIAAVLVATAIDAQAQEGRNIRFGVGTHFAQSKGDARIDIEELGKIGFNSFRDELYWAAVEKGTGAFSIPKKLLPYDRAILFSKEWGVSPLIILSYGNPIYTPKGMPRDDASRRAFAEYARFVADRYKGRVYGYEIWNEWNKSAGNKDKSLPGDVDSYWSLVQTVEPVIRSADKEAKIIVGAVAGKEKKWLLDLVSKNGFENVADGLSVHPYNFCDGRSSYPESTISWLLSLQEDAFRVRKREVPLYVTEIGWPTNIGRCGTPADLAGDYLARLFLLAPSVSSLRGLYIYDHRDDGPDKAEREHNFGIVELDGKEKPAAVLLREVMPVLNGFRFQSVESKGDSFLVKYSALSGEVKYFAWRKSGPPRDSVFGFQCNSGDSFGVRVLGEKRVDPVSHFPQNDICQVTLSLRTRPVEVIRRTAGGE